MRHRYKFAFAVYGFWRTTLVYTLLSLALFMVLGVLLPLASRPPLPVPQGYIIHSRAISPYTSLTSLSVYAAARVLDPGAHAYVLFIGSINTHPVAVLGDESVGDGVAVVPPGIARALGIQGREEVVISYPGTGRYRVFRAMVGGVDDGFVRISLGDAAWIRAVPRGYSSLVVVTRRDVAEKLSGAAGLAPEEPMVLIDNYTWSYMYMEPGEPHRVRPGLYMYCLRGPRCGHVLMLHEGNHVVSMDNVVSIHLPMAGNVTVLINGTRYYSGEAGADPIVLRGLAPGTNITVTYHGYSFAVTYRGGFLGLRIPYPYRTVVISNSSGIYAVFYGGGLIVPPLVNGSYMLSAAEKYVVWSREGLEGYRPRLGGGVVVSRVYSEALRNYNVLIESPARYSVLRHAGMVLPVIVFYTVSMSMLAAVTVLIAATSVIGLDRWVIERTRVLMRLGAGLGGVLRGFTAVNLLSRLVSVSVAAAACSFIFILMRPYYLVPLTYPEPGVTFPAVLALIVYHGAAYVGDVARLVYTYRYAVTGVGQG